jgi:8-oxo-dGTP pyrophosphatase MutT (NUDIX family)
MTSTANSRTSDPVIRAAGGIVCRAASDTQIEVLLVGGSKTDPDYRGFPKGKQEPGESIEMTALREIREETGIRVDLLALVGISEYTFTAREGHLHSKTVRYYLARPTGGDLAERDGERSGVGWAPVEEAHRRLTYDCDRELLRRALALIERVPLYKELVEQAS